MLSAFLIAAAEAVPSEASQKIDFLRPEGGLALWTIITFVLLLVFLGWKVWGPLMKMIDEREKSIQDAVDQARHERSEAERLLTEQQAAIAEARREAAELVRKNRAEVDAAKAELMERAKSEADQLLAMARRTIDDEKRKALAEVRQLAVELAIAAAGKLVTKSVDADVQRSLAEEFIASVPIGAPGLSRPAAADAHGQPPAKVTRLGA